MSKKISELTWVEISKEALAKNIEQFRKLIDSTPYRDGLKKRLLCPCVKSNAYGHGLVETGRIFLESGADWLSVNSLYEAKELREAGIDSPILILGYVAMEGLEEACKLDLRMIVYNYETIEKLGEISQKLEKKVHVHVKVETGNNRQGVLLEELTDFIKHIGKFPNIEIEGMSTHFANIEDTTDHSYAMTQIEKFKNCVKVAEEICGKIPVKHCANSAATILFSETHFDLVRVGIASYGMWPSRETYVSYLQERKEGFTLTPAFNWKTKIAQIKKVPAGEYVGYGCTYKTTHETRLAILPVGYYDGYDRGISNGYVLVHGKRAFLCGRVCMNIIVVDVTDIEEAKLEDEIVLIGNQKDETVSAEQFGTWADTINYEVTTRVNDRIPRVMV